MSVVTLSVALCLVSALCYAGAALLQERAAHGARADERAVLRSGTWWAALSLNGAGAVLHVLALRWGPLSLVQALGVLTIVCAMVMTALSSRQSIRGVGWAGAGLTSGGLAGLASLVAPTSQSALSVGDQVAVSGLTLAGIASVLAAGARARRPLTRSIAHAAAAGAAYAVASVHAKVVVDGWSPGEPSAEVAGIALMVLLAVTGTFASQLSYRDSGVTVPLATMTLANPITAAAIGVVVLGDGFRYGATGVFGGGLAAVAASTGLLILMKDRLDGEAGGSRPHAVRIR